MTVLITLVTSVDLARVGGLAAFQSPGQVLVVLVAARSRRAFRRTRRELALRRSAAAGRVDRTPIHYRSTLPRC